MRARMYELLLGRALRVSTLLGVTLVVALSAGCVSVTNLCQSHKPPTGPVCRIATKWENSLFTTSDTVNGGAPLHGIVGRVYLFGDEIKTPLSCEGTLWVDLYDDRPCASGGQSKPLERWMFPKEIMAQLLRKDLIGWGYTIFLPWVSTYRPDITPIRLVARFQANGGAPLYDNSGTMTFMHGDRPPMVISSRRDVPGMVTVGGQAPAGK